MAVSVTSKGQVTIPKQVREALGITPGSKVEFTGSGYDRATGLIQITHQQFGRVEEANKATAHLYFSNPLSDHSSFLNNLFSTHPPIEERIRLLRAM